MTAIRTDDGLPHEALPVVTCDSNGSARGWLLENGNVAKADASSFVNAEDGPDNFSLDKMFRSRRCRRPSLREW